MGRGSPRPGWRQAGGPVRQLPRGGWRKLPARSTGPPCRLRPAAGGFGGPPGSTAPAAAAAWPARLDLVPRQFQLGGDDFSTVLEMRIAERTQNVLLCCELHDDMVVLFGLVQLMYFFGLFGFGCREASGTHRLLSWSVSPRRMASWSERRSELPDASHASSGRLLLHTAEPHGDTLHETCRACTPAAADDALGPCQLTLHFFWGTGDCSSCLWHGRVCMSKQPGAGSADHLGQLFILPGRSVGGALGVQACQ